MASFIVVGAGVFGLSFARYARHCGCEVTLFDSQRKDAASWTEGKIIREDYPDQLYADLARLAREDRDGETTFKKCPRMVWTDDRYTIDDNQNTGWIEARKEMMRELAAAKSNGITVIKKTVDHLVWDKSTSPPTCMGVVAGGIQYTADSTVLALGGATEAFLQKEGRPFEFLSTVMVPWCISKLDESQYNILKTIDIYVKPGILDFLPPNEDRKIWVNNAGKIARVLNTLEDLGYPPEMAQYCIDTRDLLEKLIIEYIPGFTMQEWTSRCCIDAFTADQHFIVDELDNSQRVHIASGGSLHAWKFYGFEFGRILHGIITGEESPYRRIWSKESHRKGGRRPIHGEVTPQWTLPTTLPIVISQD